MPYFYCLQFKSIQITMEIKLDKISSLPPENVNKDDCKIQTKAYAQEIAALQEKLFASKTNSLLIVLQGMDSSGKSSTVRDVFKYVNPMGIHTKSYKKPTDEEFDHDFLWRVHPHAPGKGMISIFDRSHYEEVLIQRVHHWVDEKRISQRFEMINNFEQLLKIEANTTILKFFLHISYEQQEIELQQRIDDPEKNWKYNADDWEERKFWNDYMKAYEDVFKNCSPDIPWTIVPADKAWYKRFIVAKTIYEALIEMDLDWPKVDIKKP